MIQLKQLSKSDAKDIARMINNEKVWNNLRDHIPFPYVESDAHIFIDLTLDENPQQHFGIVNELNELCGVIGLVKQEGVHRLCAEIGYWLGEKYWGKGIATEAVRLITQYGFGELKLERIYTGIFSFNVASMRVLEKNGYFKEGISRNAVIKNGQIYDEHRYAKLKDD